MMGGIAVLEESIHWSVGESDVSGEDRGKELAVPSFQKVKKDLE